ncbi:MAG: circadian clock protein KaiB [Elusimicrobia bacterium]|nr:circadian clock protein KaiB [Candidatus Obscuribacterium magneticum]
MDKILLKLYITGKTANSERARENLRRIMETDLRDQYELTVIDVLERPQLAEDENIIATPTVVKERPEPVRRIVGDLSNTEQVLSGLDLARVTPSDGDRFKNQTEKTERG